MNFSRCGAAIEPRQVVEPVRDDSGERRYRHREVCAPMQPALQRAQNRDQSQNGNRLAPQPPIRRGRLNKKVDVLALWQELLGRKLTADELLQLFIDPHVIAMLKTSAATAHEAGLLGRDTAG